MQENESGCFFSEQYTSALKYDIIPSYKQLANTFYKGVKISEDVYSVLAIF